MILISIVGDFYSSILPVFYEMKNEIRKHILVYDDFKKDEQKALKLIDRLKDFSNTNRLDMDTIGYKIDEDSYDGIVKLSRYIKQQSTNNDEKIVINTTDGLSNVNTILTKKLIEKNVYFLSYDRFDNQCNLINQESMLTLKVNKSIPIIQYLELKNVKVKAFEDKTFALKYEKEIKLFFTKYLDEYKSFKIYAYQNSYLKNKNEFPNVYPLIKKMGLEDFKKNQVLITGTMYEFYVYLLLKDLDFDDIEVGVVLHDYGIKEYFIPNEFDILLMKNNHLHMVECKFTDNVKKGAIVYKYISLQTLLDEDGKMMILTNDSTYTKKLDFYDNTQHLPWKRALNKDILLRGTIFNEEEKFLSEVKNYFGV